LFRANYLKQTSPAAAVNVSLTFAECLVNNLAVIPVGKIGGNMGDEKRRFWNLMKSTFNNKTAFENVISILSLYLPPIFPLSSPQDTLINSNRPFWRVHRTLQTLITKIQTIQQRRLIENEVLDKYRSKPCREAPLNEALCYCTLDRLALRGRNPEIHFSLSLQSNHDPYQNSDH
jgi:hypothetical protein